MLHSLCILNIHFMYVAFFLNAEYPSNIWCEYVCVFHGYCLHTTCMHLLSTFHLWCMCPAYGLLYMYIMGAIFLLNIYGILHISCVLHECYMHLVLFHSFHIVCYLPTAYIFHVLRVHAMYYMWHPYPCTTCDCVCVWGAGCMCSSSGFRQLRTGLPCASGHPDFR